MAYVEFVDRDGVTGTVDEQLRLDYAGERDRIASYVDRLRDEYERRESGSRASKDALQELVIDLPQRFPVREVQMYDTYGE